MRAGIAALPMDVIAEGIVRMFGTDATRGACVDCGRPVRGKLRRARRCPACIEARWWDLKARREQPA